MVQSLSFAVLTPLLCIVLAGCTEQGGDTIIGGIVDGGLMVTIDGKTKTVTEAKAIKRALSPSGEGTIIEGVFDDESRLSIGFSYVVDTPLLATLPDDGAKLGGYYINPNRRSYFATAGEFNVTRVTSDSIWMTFNFEAHDEDSNSTVNITLGKLALPFTL